MRRQMRVAGMAAAMLLLAGLSASAADAVHWQTNFAAAKAIAKKSHKLIMVDFYAEW